MTLRLLLKRGFFVVCPLLIIVLQLLTRLHRRRRWLDEEKTFSLQYTPDRSTAFTLPPHSSSEKNFSSALVNNHDVEPTDPWKNGEDASFIHGATKRRLEFVHITKTGGTAIELAAAKANITWGICHYQANEECRRDDNVKRKGIASPQKLKQGIFGQYEPWHTPHDWFESSFIYNNETDTFVVVRNPYERIISEYYCNYYGYNKEFYSGRFGRERNIPGGYMGRKVMGSSIRRNNRGGERNKNRMTARRGGTINSTKPRRQLVDENRNWLQGKNVKKDETQASLNEWIKQALDEQKYFHALDGKGPSPKSAHVLPQRYYVFDREEKQIVTHVLRYETIHDGFARLMKEYNLSVVLPVGKKDYVNSAVRSGDRQHKMTVANLTRPIVERINEYYFDDFRLLNYPML